MAAAAGEPRPQKKRLSAKAAQSAGTAAPVPPAAASSSSTAAAGTAVASASLVAPARAKATAPTKAAAPATARSPPPEQSAPGMPHHPSAQQQQAVHRMVPPGGDPRADAGEESIPIARLVRLDLLPPGSLQDGRSPAPLGLPWERDATQHSPGAYTTPSVVYLGTQPEVKFGRHPQLCGVVLDCPDVPQMISRVHARLVCAEGTWVLTDEKSVNGVLVNSTPLKAPRFLRSGDVLCFGRHIPERPIFEYVFEERPGGTAQNAVPPQSRLAVASVPEAATAVPPGTAGDQAAPAVAGQVPGALDDNLEAQLATVQQEAQQCMQEAAQQRQDAKRKRSSLDLQELQAELVCSVCQDWIVHAASLECGHSFCRECIDQWLTQKQFHCPVCRNQVQREPTASRALDIIVEKSVQGAGEGGHGEWQQRVQAADQRASKRQKHLSQLQDSVKEALSKGKAFFHVESVWSRREKQVFEKGIKDYIGEAREVYCQLIGLTVSWIHSASETKLNQVLHNVGLAREYVDKPEKEIRQRLLMFLRYG